MTMFRIAIGVFLLASATACSEQAETIRTYNMGERVQAGPLVYDAFQTNWSLKLGDGADARSPANRFLLVRLSIHNGGATDSGVPTLSLVDDRGQVFNELTDGTGVNNWLGIVRKIGPIQAKEGEVAFDVPPRHYRLRVADETDQIAAYIDLPLTIDLDTRVPE